MTPTHRAALRGLLAGPAKLARPTARALLAPGFVRVVESGDAAGDILALVLRAETYELTDAGRAELGHLDGAPFNPGDRVVWSAPAGPRLVGLWAKRVDVPALCDEVDRARSRVHLRPEGTVGTAKGDRPERPCWVDMRYVRRKNAVVGAPAGAS